MSKRKFNLSAGMDMEVRVTIDTSIVTEEIAREVTTFWASQNDVMSTSNGDRYEAVARYAASRIIGYLLDGYSESGAAEELQKQEGWCWHGPFGITVEEIDMPSFSPCDFHVSEEIEG